MPCRWSAIQRAIQTSSGPSGEWCAVLLCSASVAVPRAHRLQVGSSTCKQQCFLSLTPAVCCSIVTKLKCRLHDVSDCLGGMITLPYDKVRCGLSASHVESSKHTNE